MLKTDNYYEVKTEDWNWIPVKLLKQEAEIYTLENLISKKIEKDHSIYIREIEISQIHLDRIGFDKGFYKDLVSYRIAFPVGHDISNLAFPYFGYAIFHKNEFDTFFTHFASLKNETEELYKNDPYSIHDKKFIAKWKTIFNINELFELLEKYEITIPSKEKILIG